MIRIGEFLSNHELIFTVLLPIFLGQAVIEEIRKVPRSPGPRLVGNLIEPNIKGGAFGK
jgi:hypothetical protein